MEAQGLQTVAVTRVWVCWQVRLQGPEHTGVCGSIRSLGEVHYLLSVLDLFLNVLSTVMCSGEVAHRLGNQATY